MNLRPNHKRLAKLLLLALLLGLSNILNAATIDLRGMGSNGGGYGNSLEFNSPDGISVTLTAYGETGSKSPAGSSNFLFESAEVYSWNSGIGVCNQQEGTASGGCSSNEHEVDTVKRDDLLVFKFDQNVNFESITVDPYNGPGNDPNDRDIIYWIGQVSSMPDFTAETFNTLSLLYGFNNEIFSGASSSFSPFTHSLSGIGNILLLSGNHKTGCNSSCEAYKISNITVAPVPLPASLWLMISTLLILIKRQSTKPVS
jgi:hypothetical protein